MEKNNDFVVNDEKLHDNCDETAMEFKAKQE